MNLPIPVDPNYISKCCLSKCFVNSSDENTSYYECKKCGEPCDVFNAKNLKDAP